MTEAARAVLQHGFSALGLCRIYAMHYTSNPASSLILQKIEMRYEGRLRQHIRKGDEFRDLEVYGILAEEWAGGARSEEGGARSEERRVRR